MNKHAKHIKKRGLGSRLRKGTLIALAATVFGGVGIGAAVSAYAAGAGTNVPAASRSANKPSSGHGSAKVSSSAGSDAPEANGGSDDGHTISGAPGTSDSTASGGADAGDGTSTADGDGTLPTGSDNAHNGNGTAAEHDNVPPQFKGFRLLDSKGRDIDLGDSNAVDKNQHLKVDDRGVTIEATVTDKDKAGWPAGVDHLEVTYDKHKVGGDWKCNTMQADGTTPCSLQLDSKFLSAVSGVSADDASDSSKSGDSIGKIGTLELKKLGIIAVDAAGNMSGDAGLSDQSPFKKQVTYTVTNGDKTETKTRTDTVVSAIDFYRFPVDVVAEDYVSLRVTKDTANGEQLCMISKNGDNCSNQSLTADQAVVKMSVADSGFQAALKDFAQFQPQLTYVCVKIENGKPVSTTEKVYKPGDTGVTLDVGKYDISVKISYTDIPQFFAEVPGGSRNGDSSAPELVHVSHMIVDNTPPQLSIDIAGSVGDKDKFKTQVGDSGRNSIKVVASRPRAIRYELHAIDSLSGVGSMTFDYKEYDTYGHAMQALEGQSVKSKDLHIQGKEDETGNGMKAEVSFDEDGVYLLSDMAFKATHANLKNPEVSKGLKDIKGFDPGYDMIVVDGGGNKSAKIDLSSASKSKDGSYYRGSVTAKLSITDKWFEVARQLPRRDNGFFTATLCTTKDKTPAGSCPAGDSIDLMSDKNKDKATLADKVTLSQFKPSKQGDDTWTLSVKMPAADVSKADALSREGNYSLRMNYKPINGDTIQASSSFGIDYTAPSIDIQAKQFSKGDTWYDQNHYAEPWKGHDGAGVRVVATHPATQDDKADTTLTYRMCAMDKLNGGKNEVGSNVCGGKAGQDSAASDVASLNFTYVQYSTYQEALDAARGHAPDSKKADTRTAKAAIDPKTGRFWLEQIFQADGAYPLADMTVQACDTAGNCTKNMNLAKPQEGKDNRIQVTDGDGKSSPLDLGYDMIVVDATDAAKAASLEVHDVGQLPASDDPYYHRGSVAAKLTIADKWFAVNSKLHGQADHPLKYSLCKAHESGYAKACTADGNPQNDLPGVSLTDFKPKSDGVTWTDDVSMPVSANDSQHRSVEGLYELRLDYAPIGGEDASAHSDTAKFGIDYTAPTFDNTVTYSTVAPAQWGWVFAPGETVGIQSQDAVSGINDADASFAGVWQKAPQEPEQVQTVKSVNGAIAVTFGTDSQRLTVSGSKVDVKDVAGNEASFDLGSAKSNLPKNTVGIAIDTMAPVVSVTYDNNDVRNGKYYKANRHATVTLTESNFDFIQANDKDRTVITSSVDGSKNTVSVKDFKNQNGDGKTWTASVPCEKDGDWIVDAGLTDPAGHASTAYHDEFAIDTQKPTLDIKFDNNSSESGNYYKAVRHATITMRERNVSPAETVISVGAKNAAGADVAAPVPTAWTDPSKDYERTSHVDFMNELHYTLKVEATDLAGNVADVAQEPEFVIDMTKPSLTISNVANKTAYAGKVTPKIDYSDTNFDPLFADYKLTRTHKAGKSPDESAQVSKNKDNDVFLESNERKDATSKTVTFPDVEHTVDNDDVYTLTAKVKDKAGNESEQKVVYSLNRFGSNYIFDGTTQNILGKYIKTALPVKITETNVSGIDTAKSHMELVHDQDVRPISAGSDYGMVRDDTTGWQQITYDFPAKLFASDGYYRLRLSSVDNAGNLSQNTMDKKNAERNGDAQVNFAVDDKAPDSRVGGLSSRSVFYAPSHNFVADARDDVALKSVTMSVDGKQVGKWTGKAVLLPMTYTLGADQKAHSVELTSVDMAGNTTVSDYSGVVVASSWWAYAMARGFLLPGIAAGIIMLAFIIVAVVMIVRHRGQIAYRKNVFGKK